MAARAAVLEPMTRMAAAEGPMKVSPAAARRGGEIGVFERKP
jgi:hypothetical protein